MNFLPREKRIEILRLLVEGACQRSIARLTDINRGTVSRYALTFGDGAFNVHDWYVRDLACPHLQLDEQWSYVHTKQKRVKDADPPEFGDAFTYVAIDAASRFVVAFHIGKRDDRNTRVFVNDLRRRVNTMPRITSDGFAAYPGAIVGNFGRSVDYAVLVKNYGQKRQDGGFDAYEPPREPFVVKKIVFGSPDVDDAHTSYVERFNGTLRHFVGRKRRRTYAFSKKLEHHRAAVALKIVHYNFCAIPETLRCTPAMEIGLTDHVWNIEEFFNALMTVPAVGPPEAKPLAFVTPDTTARELPNGRGFLRVVQSRLLREPPAGPDGGQGPRGSAGGAARPRAPDAEIQRTPKSTSPSQLGLFDKPEKPKE